MALVKQHPGVWITDDRMVLADKELLDFLKAQVPSSPFNRVRLCAHKDPNDSIHEMIIVLGKDTYVRPHRHVNKTESFHVIEGAADAVFFDDNGDIADVVFLGAANTDGTFFYRLTESRYHTQIIRSPFLVVHEVTSGPFNRCDTEFPIWSSDITDNHTRTEFFRELTSRVAEFRRRHST